jgi:hypothetical protein
MQDIRPDINRDWGESNSQVVFGYVAYRELRWGYVRLGNITDNNICLTNNSPSCTL